jgi:hypothetical protein
MNDTPSTSWITRPRTVLTITGVLVLIVGSVLVFNAVFGNSTTTISFKEAFEQFAAEQGSDVEVEDDGLPVPGVYRYQTTGGESTKLLTGASREYPAESVITITRSGCGVRMKWTAVRERSEYFDVCRVDGRLVLKGYGGAHEFFGMRNEHAVTCSTQTLLIPDLENGDSASGACEGGGLKHNRTTTSVKAVEVLVGKEKVDGFIVETKFVAEGSFNGTTLRTMTFDEDGVLLSWADAVSGFSPTPVGNADYEENFSLTLMPS